MLLDCNQSMLLRHYEDNYLLTTSRSFSWSILNFFGHIRQRSWLLCQVLFAQSDQMTKHDKNILTMSLLPLLARAGKDFLAPSVVLVNRSAFLVLQASDLLTCIKI